MVKNSGKTIKTLARAARGSPTIAYIKIASLVGVGILAWRTLEIL